VEEIPSYFDEESSDVDQSDEDELSSSDKDESSSIFIYYTKCLVNSCMLEAINSDLWVSLQVLL